MITKYYILSKPKGKFLYKFILKNAIDRDLRKYIVAWLKENCGKYNENYIYWGLKKDNIWCDGPEIYFRTEDLAMAFKLRWSYVSNI